MTQNGERVDIDAEVQGAEMTDAEHAEVEESGPPLDDLPAVVRALLLGYDEA